MHRRSQIETDKRNGDTEIESLLTQMQKRRSWRDTTAAKLPPPSRSPCRDSQPRAKMTGRGCHIAMDSGNQWRFHLPGRFKHYHTKEGTLPMLQHQPWEFTLDSDCWRGHTAILRTCRGVCWLHPAVILRVPLIDSLK